MTARRRGEVVDGKKICPGCHVDKPVDQYSQLRGRCRPCVASYARERRARLGRAPQAPMWDAQCDRCGADFRANKKRWRYCSRECFRAYRNTANWVHLNNRRTRLRVAFVESFDRVEIFERDDWICQLCGEPVERDERAPHPLSPSIDHVIPLARGGQHSRANVQTAHLRCNTRKGVSVQQVA